MRAYVVVLIILFHLAYLGPLLRPGLFKTHDGELHVARFAAYTKAFTELQIPPRWAGDLNYMYGTPLFIFYYPLPGYIGSLLHATGFTFENSYKIMMGLAFIIAPVGFYYWMAELVPPFAAFFGSVLYGLAPYHFLDLYVRGALPELLSLAIIPWVFFMIEKIYKHPRSLFPIIGGVYYALLILAHNAMSLIFSPLFVLYGFIRSRDNNKAMMTVAGMLAVGLALSAFFWIPALLEQRYTLSTMLIGLKYKDNFPEVTQLIISPWGFGPDVTKSGGLSPQIGPLHLLIALLSLPLIFNKIKHRRLLIASFMLLIISIFLSLPYSSFLWSHVNLLSKFEFPWRFTALSSFSIAVLGALFATYRGKVFALLILLILGLVSFSYTKVRPPYETKNDAFYLNYGPSTDFGAVTPRWTAGDPSTYPQEPMQIIGGQGTITNLKRSSTRHTFNVYAQNHVTVLDNTLYFPGWRAKVNGSQVPIEFQDMNHRGLVTFAVPSGRSNVEVSFGQTVDRTIADGLTLLTLLALLLVGVIKTVHRGKSYHA